MVANSFVYVVLWKWTRGGGESESFAISNTYAGVAFVSKLQKSFEEEKKEDESSRNLLPFVFPSNKWEKACNIFGWVLDKSPV